MEIKILFCGVRHSDIHTTARNEWGSTMYPVVPGHEIVGTVTRIGENVSKFKLVIPLALAVLLIRADIVPIAKKIRNSIVKTVIHKFIIHTNRTFEGEALSILCN